MNHQSTNNVNPGQPSPSPNENEGKAARVGESIVGGWLVSWMGYTRRYVGKVSKAMFSGRSSEASNV